MPSLPFLLGLVMAAALTAYALLAGADYGGGVWDLLATGQSPEAAARQRATIARAIGPVWEANHVWLILVVTVLFTGFPPAFAWLGTNLHLPIMLALIGIVLRGSAFVFRAYGPEKRSPAPFSKEFPEKGAGLLFSEDQWGRVFAVASTVTPVLLGILVGAITEGEPGQWLTPFSLSVGVFTLTLFAYLAAVYLTLEAREPDVRDAFRARALAAGVLAGVMALTTLLLARGAPHVWEGLTASVWALPLHVTTAAAAIGTLAALWARRYWWARSAAIAQVTLIVWGWALTQYPYLIRPQLTFDAAAAPRPTLVLLVQVLSLGAAVVLPSLVYLFRVFGPRQLDARPSGG
jgi:cytochrome d ubiquinol oxidase subunit II